MLSHEAGRLGVPNPNGLPDPAGLAGDISAMLAAGGHMMLDDPRGQREIRNGAMDIVSDSVEGVARLERDLGRAEERMGRMAEEAAEGLQHMGVNVD